MVFVVEIEREDELAIFRHVPHKTRTALIKIVVAIGFAESILLSVVVIGIVAEPADRAVHFCEISIITIAAKYVPGGEMKRGIQARHFHDEIDGPTGLRAKLQSRTRANDFNALYRIQDLGYNAIQENRIARS